MSLPKGTRLGPYEIQSLLGAGGMGQVYRARDTRLDRAVAVKVLRADAAPTAATRERFEREARAISRLSHPRVCALFDVGNADGIEYLVMELIEGETLAAHLAKGPLPLDELHRYGVQIAQAIAAAHREGIVHRDLKPGNVMLTSSGVKLLDFGLAKALQPAPTAADAPTVTPLTSQGTWLGTAPYMAPEVLQGRPADTRSDLFALGAVLHEMATGTRAFTGDNAATITGAILHQDPPPVSSIRPEVGPAFDRLVRECLAKDPDTRWQSAHDVALQLAADDVAARPVDAQPRGARSPWLGWTLAAIAMVIAVASLLTRDSTRSGIPERLDLHVNPPTRAFAYNADMVTFAISPDGRDLAFVATDGDGVRRAWLRRLTAVDAKPLPGTEGAESVFWSPDGSALAFFAGGMLRRLDLTTGVALPLAEVPRGSGLSGTWGANGEILFASSEGQAIYRVTTAGGPATVLVKPDPARGETKVQFPHHLPDGRSYLYLLNTADGRWLQRAAPGEAAVRVGPIESNVAYLDSGHLVFAKHGTLMAQRFDAATGQLAGEPIAMAPQVRFFLTTGAAAFAASRSGSIVYQAQRDRSRLAWVDRAGHEGGSVGSPGDDISLRITPSGQAALLSRALPSTGTFDVWSVDLSRGTESRLTPEDVRTEVYPVPVPGTDDVIYGVPVGNAPRLNRHNLATSKTEVLLPGTRFQIASDVSPDGTRLAYSERGDNGNFVLWTLPLAEPSKATVLRRSRANEGSLRYSPDGRHYTFTSTESGRQEIYVAAVAGGAAVPVSVGGAVMARWPPDGREIIYLSLDRRLVSVPFRSAPAITLGVAVTLFGVGEKGWIDFDLAPDGKRFLAIVPDLVADEQPLTAILNWRGAPR
ncbi:MAG: protein kinase [Vicinamibacterales bacterium]